jgi:uncharacterized protein
LLLQKYRFPVNALAFVQINLVFFSWVGILSMTLGQRGDSSLVFWSEDMKIGVLSDTHLSQVTQKFIDIYNTYLSDVDMIIHAGDIVSPNILDFLEKSVCHAVQGNMDPLEIKAVLPEKKIIEVGVHRVGIIHGWGPAGGLEDRILPLFPNVDVIIYGHSHITANHVKKGVLLFNPGTATGYSAKGLNSIGILDVSETVQGRIIMV